MRTVLIKRITLGDLGKSLTNDIDAFNLQYNGTIFHETTFNAIISQNFNTTLSYYIATYANNIIGIFPCHSIKKKNLLISHSNLTSCEIPYGGWVFDKSMVTSDFLYKNLRLQMNEALSCYTSIFHSEHPPSKAILQYNTAVLPLTIEEDSLLQEYVSSNTRHNIRRATKKGVKLIEINSINDFISLYKELKISANLKYSESNINFISKIFSEYKPKDQAFILGVQYEGQTISTVLNVGNKNVCHAYIAGRIGKLPNNLYQNELLWWSGILKAKLIGSRYYDLCVVDQIRLPSIAQFKMGFSKNLIGLYTFSKRSPLFRVLSKLHY